MKQWQMVIVMLLLCGGLFTPAVSHAERDRPVRIGALTVSWGPTPPIAALRHSLREMGYRENKDFEFAVRFTQGEVSALPMAAREVVEYGADLIVVDNDAAAQAAQKATARVPIVFAGPVDALALGLVESFAQPGGNVTGVTDLRGELGPKRLELFRELIPSLKRILLPYNANDPYSVAMVETYRDAARRLGVELVERAVQSEQEAQAALIQIRQGDVDGILGPPSISLNLAGIIAEIASQQAIPTMFATSFMAERGILASYGPDLYETGRQAARLVDKIIKGDKPARIPVEVNSKIEFAINLKTAQALGLTIPPEILFQATKVIR